ncbi:hypothetical protein [Actinopolymorpha sp. B9G3]|uniref:hypothetical protein n=1 Tax=Actinopolymorpha sp. B9G3 TaxID=3158970 RepID=UPI0032D9A20D
MSDLDAIRVKVHELTSRARAARQEAIDAALTSSDPRVREMADELASGRQTSVEMLSNSAYNEIFQDAMEATDSLRPPAEDTTAGDPELSP